jgi:hypothetical protein
MVIEKEISPRDSKQVQPSGIILEICCRCCLIVANYNLRIEGSRCGLDKEIALDG